MTSVCPITTRRRRNGFPQIDERWSAAVARTEGQFSTPVSAMPTTSHHPATSRWPKLLSPATMTLLPMSLMGLSRTGLDDHRRPRFGRIYPTRNCQVSPRITPRRPTAQRRPRRNLARPAASACATRTDWSCACAANSGVRTSGTQTCSGPKSTLTHTSPVLADPVPHCHASTLHVSRSMTPSIGDRTRDPIADAN